MSKTDRNSKGADAKEKKPSFLEKHADKFAIWASITTILSFALSIYIYLNPRPSESTDTNTNLDDVAVMNKETREKLLQAEEKYFLGKYSVASEIYNSIIDQSDVANLNQGYLYAHGYGVEQSTDKASEYYVKAYEMGNAQGLKNYVAVNLYYPASYESTLAALKYGFEHDDETAVKYLSICNYGELQDTSIERLNISAQEFLILPYDSQIQKLKELKKDTGFDTVYVDENETLTDTEFETFTKLSLTNYYKNIIDHPTIVDENNNKIIVPLHSVNKVVAYRKTIYSFYMSEYFEPDSFYKI